MENLKDVTTKSHFEQSQADEKPCTPESITGVLTTEKGRCKVTIDYLRATFPNTPGTKRRIRETFEPGKGTKTTLYGYDRRAVVMEKGFILWNDNEPKLGILLELPASALAHWSMPIDWLLEIILSNGGKIGRLDIAFDDFSGLVKLATVKTHLETGDMVCRARTWRGFTEQAGIGSGPARLTGIGIGSRESETYCRIYDKRIQQTKPDGSYDGPDHWMRVELELKGDRATAAGKMIIDTLRAGQFSQWAAGLLYGWLDFKIRNGSDSNKTRWETASWWIEFVGLVSKERLTLPAKIQTIEDVKNWFENSISPMAAVLLLQDDIDGVSGYDWLMDVIASGEQRWKDKHKRLAKMEKTE